MRLVRSAGTSLFCFLMLSPICIGHAAPITFSGTVSYTGSYSVDSLYVVAVDINVSLVFGYVALPAGPPPLSLPYAIDFDNAGAIHPLMLAAILDIDGSGFDPSSLAGMIPSANIVGWYASQANPTMVDVGSSQAGLDFFLPTAEIRGTFTFHDGQTWVDLYAQPMGGFGRLAHYDVAGPYELRGLYPGTWVAGAFGPDFSMCYGDPTCMNPTAIPLASGEIRTGIDFDFSTVAVEGTSWGKVKSLYR